MVLIAVAAGLGGLAQSSELTILRAAGLSIGRFSEGHVCAFPHFGRLDYRCSIWNA